MFRKYRREDYDHICEEWKAEFEAAGEGIEEFNRCMEFLGLDATEEEAFFLDLKTEGSDGKNALLETLKKGQQSRTNVGDGNTNQQLDLGGTKKSQYSPESSKEIEKLKDQAGQGSDSTISIDVNIQPGNRFKPDGRSYKQGKRNDSDVRDDDA